MTAIFHHRRGREPTPHAMLWTGAWIHGGAMTLEQGLFLAILVVALGLLVTERLRADLVALLIILALYLARILDAPKALSGFSAEPAIVIACVFVLTAAFSHTGLSLQLG